MKILLAMDASEYSEAALEMLIAQNRVRGTEIRVAHVVESMEVLS